MGKMHDALKKAEEEREARRRAQTQPAPEREDFGLRTTPVLEPTARMPLPRDLAEPTPQPSMAKTLTGGIPTTGVTPRNSDGYKQTVVTPKSGVAATHLLDVRLIAFLSPADPRVEQFRSVRTSLLCLNPEPRSLVVTSALSGEGKALTAANLAVILAEDGRSRILVVDADLRGGKSVNFFGASDAAKGFSDVLAGFASPGEVIQDTGISHLHYVSAGGRVSNPGGLLSGPALGTALRQWRSMFDRVVISAPPCMDLNDSHLIGREVDGAIFVIRLGSTPRRTSVKACDSLTAAGVRVIGCILTDARDPESRPLPTVGST